METFVSLILKDLLFNSIITLVQSFETFPVYDNSFSIFFIVIQHYTPKMTQFQKSLFCLLIIVQTYQRDSQTLKKVILHLHDLYTMYDAIYV